MLFLLRIFTFLTMTTILVISLKKTVAQEPYELSNTFTVGQSDFQNTGMNQYGFSDPSLNNYDLLNNGPIGTYPEVTAENSSYMNIGSVDGQDLLRSQRESDVSFVSSIGTAISEEGKRYWSDFKNLYSLSNAGNYAVTLGMAGVLANTSMDRHFIDWYQNDVRSQGTDDASKIFKVFGEGKYFLPLYIGGSLIYRYLEERNTFSVGENGNVIGEFLSRSARATVIGLPGLVASQYLLGAGRPDEGYHSSQWRPFNDNNSASGHAYMGSIPFLTIAEMTDSLLLKGVMYTGSTLTGWSRINDNSHYLSQVILGWYLGYLSVRATSTTEKRILPRGLTLFPIFRDKTTAIGASWEY